jgi:hypothetical protein
MTAARPNACHGASVKLEAMTLATNRRWPKATGDRPAKATGDVLALDPATDGACARLDPATHRASIADAAGLKGRRTWRGTWRGTWRRAGAGGLDRRRGRAQGRLRSTRSGDAPGLARWRLSNRRRNTPGDRERLPRLVCEAWGDGAGAGRLDRRRGRAQGRRTGDGLGDAPASGRSVKRNRPHPFAPGLASARQRPGACHDTGDRERLPRAVCEDRAQKPTLARNPIRRRPAPRQERHPRSEKR